MITWVIDEASGVYIGPLNKEESDHTKSILNKHGNSFKEVQVFITGLNILVCSYQQLLDQENNS
jgi:hypothetical protein